MISRTLQADFQALSEDPRLYAFLREKRIYLTGATGQIGWYLTQLLCNLHRQHELNCRITAHVHTQERLQACYPDHAGLPCHFNIDDNPARILKTESFDLVIHCASLASPKFFTTQPVDVMIPNGIQVHEMLGEIHQNAPQTHFVYLSTTGVTGFVPDTQRPSGEADYGPLSCTDLKNCYLESKRFGEMMTMEYGSQYGIKSLIVRPSITFGPGFDLSDGRSYADFTRALLSKSPIRLNSDGQAIRNFLYISDFVRGLLLAINQMPGGSVMNIASPKPIRILDLAEQLNTQILGKPPGFVEHLPPVDGINRVEFQSTDAQIDQLQALGWQPRVSVVDGFRRTLDHYQETSK